jgi:hypothetical protein
MMHSIVASQQQQQHHQQQPLENGINKTPARNGTRRALGDISNRKTSIAAAPFNNDNVSKTPKPMTTTISKYTEPSKYIPTSGSKQESLRNTATTTLELSHRHPQPSLRSTTTTKRNHTNSVKFTLPQQDTKKTLTHHVPVLPSQQRHRSSTDTHAQNDTSNHSSLWNYNDESEIEFPAGRLYHEQLLLYDDDDDNDSASQLSLEGAKTFRDDFRNLFMKQHNEEMQEKEKYIQYCIQQLEHNCIITDDGTCFFDFHSCQYFECH